MHIFIKRARASHDMASNEEDYEAVFQFLCCGQYPTSFREIVTSIITIFVKFWKNFFFFFFFFFFDFILCFSQCTT